MSYKNIYCAILPKETLLIFTALDLLEKSGKLNLKFLVWNFAKINIPKKKFILLRAKAAGAEEEYKVTKNVR